MIVDPPGTQLSHVSSPAKFVEVLDLICNIQVPDVFLKATEVRSILTLLQICTHCGSLCITWSHERSLAVTSIVNSLGRCLV